MLLIVGAALGAKFTIADESDLFLAQTNSNDGDTYVFTWAELPEAIDGVGIWVRNKQLTIEGQTTETPLPAIYFDRSVGSEVRSGVFTSAATQFWGTTEFTEPPYASAVHAYYAGVTFDDVRFEGIDADYVVWAYDSWVDLEDTVMQDNVADSELVYMSCESSDSTCYVRLQTVRLYGDQTYAGVRVEGWDDTAPRIEVFGISHFQDLGGALVLTGGAGKLDIDGTVEFNGNASSSPGAGMYVEGDHVVTMSGDIVATAGDSEQLAAFYYQEGGTLWMEDVFAYDNDADGSGAAVALVNVASAEIQRSRFCSNRSGVGGELSFTGSNVMLKNTVHQQSGTPAAVESDGGALSLENVSIVGSPSVGVAFDGGTLKVVNLLLDGPSTGLGIGSGSSVDRIDYSLLYDNDVAVESDVGDVLGVGMLVSDYQPLYDDSFKLDNCGTDPLPADGSPVVDQGDPELFDSFDDSRSDIGAFGGPGSDLIDPAEPGDPIVDTGDPDSGSPSDDSGDPVGDTGVASVPSGSTWYGGGCRGGLAVVLLLGAGLASRGQRRTK